MISLPALLIALFISTSWTLPAERFQLNIDSNGELEPSRFILLRNDEGVLEMTDLSTQSITYHAKEDDVTFHLYTDNNFDEHEVLVSANLTESKYFNKTRETFFIIHGWNDDYQSELNGLIKDSMLSNYDVNVIVVDWSYASKRNYITAMWSVTTVGRIVAKFLTELADAHSLDVSSRFAIVGHSLGAHVSGNAGAALNGSLRYIVGLDPAGPLFSYGNTDNRLDSSDAEYVEVIHTSLLLGFHKPIGHCDFFPNGGLFQPGCGLDLDNVCAHGRSYEYYAESLRNSKFLGKKCSSYDDYERGLCEQNKAAVMGELEIRAKAHGKYYLKTRSQQPFAPEDLD